MIKLLPTLLILFITFEGILCSRSLLREILAKENMYRGQSQKANAVLQHLQEAIEEADQTEVVDKIMKKLEKNFNILPSTLAELRHQLGSERGTGPLLRHPLTNTDRKFGSDLSLTRLQELFNRQQH